MSLFKRIVNATLYGLAGGVFAMALSGGVFAFFLMIFMACERLGI